jgi:hypothetical protein
MNGMMATFYGGVCGVEVNEDEAASCNLQSKRLKIFGSKSTPRSDRRYDGQVV